MKSLSRHFRSIALLDAIISPDWESRYYSYNSKWSDSTEMASMRNGGGESWFLWFSGKNTGWVFIDFDLPGIENLEDIKSKFPDGYSEFLSEPAFTIEDARVLGYLKGTDWVFFGDKESSSCTKALNSFNWSAADYKKWADEYYEKELDLECLEKVFNGDLFEEIVQRLNPEMSIELLKDDLEEIGL